MNCVTCTDATKYGLRAFGLAEVGTPRLELARANLRVSIDEGRSVGPCVVQWSDHEWLCQSCGTVWVALMIN